MFFLDGFHLSVWTQWACVIMLSCCSTAWLYVCLCSSVRDCCTNTSILSMMLPHASYMVIFFNLITRHQALLDSPGLYLVTENGESVKTRVSAGEETRWWQKSLPELLSRPLECLFPEGVCLHILQRFLRQTTWLPQFLIFWKKIMRS